MQICQVPNAIIHKIEQICANFLWQRKHHKINWQNVCKPKAGGLDELDKAYAMKLAWVYLQQNSLWSKWLQNRYRHHKDFWIVNVDNNASFTWKLLLKTRVTSEQLIQIQITNGRNTSLWFDPWVKGNSLSNTLGWAYLARFNTHNYMVRRLISNKEWDSSAVELSMNVCNTIKQIKIQVDREDDFWEWVPNKGKFLLKSAWASTRIEGEQLAWCNRVWNNWCAPKMSLTTYFANLDKLPAKDRVNQWTNINNPLCVMCSTEAETRNHIF